MSKARAGPCFLWSNARGNKEIINQINRKSCVGRGGYVVHKIRWKLRSGRWMVDAKGQGRGHSAPSRLSERHVPGLRRSPGFLKLFLLESSEPEDLCLLLQVQSHVLKADHWTKVITNTISGSPKQRFFWGSKKTWLVLGSRQVRG